MGNSTISMAMFNSKLLVYQAGYAWVCLKMGHPKIPWWIIIFPMRIAKNGDKTLMKSAIANFIARSPPWMMFFQSFFPRGTSEASDGLLSHPLLLCEMHKPRDSRIDGRESLSWSVVGTGYILTHESSWSTENELAIDVYLTTHISSVIYIYIRIWYVYIYIYIRIWYIYIRIWYIIIYIWYDIYIYICEIYTRF